LYVSDDKKTNMVKLDRKPRQCMGKVKYFWVLYSAYYTLI
jgi:hypothetical protein